MTVSNAFSADNPPLEVAVTICRTLIEQRGGRFAFAGRAGSGKSTVARLLTNGDWPIVNHADTLKQEVVEWLTDALRYDFDPHSDDSFLHFANFMGLSPARIQDDLWDLLGPVYRSFVTLYARATRASFDIKPLRTYAAITQATEAIAYVDAHKEEFREVLQLYGSMSKEISADPYYWVNRTVTAGACFPICFNADTRYRQEMECLRSCGWTGVFFWIDDDTQLARRPDMVTTARFHHSEWGLAPEDCDMVVDATQPIPAVLMQLADYLAAVAPRQKAGLIHGYAT